jgi:hypothetical protein
MNMKIVSKKTMKSRNSKIGTFEIEKKEPSRFIVGTYRGSTTGLFLEPSIKFEQILATDSPLRRSVFVAQQTGHLLLQARKGVTSRRLLQFRDDPEQCLKGKVEYMGRS